MSDFDPTTAKLADEPQGFDPSTAKLVPGQGRIARLGTQQAKSPGILDRIKSAIFAPRSERDSSFAQSVVKGVEGIPAEVGKEVGAAAGQVRADYFPRDRQELIDSAEKGPAGALMDVANVPLSALTGALTSAVGRPVEQATGVRREITGTLASALVPLGGEEKVAEEAASAAKTAKNALVTPDIAEANHAAKVSRLRAEGVDPTIGQVKGGQIRRLEEAHKSNPLVGGAIRNQEQHALSTFNRALYNRVLKPLDVKFNPEAPVGRDAVKAVGDKVSAAYEQLKPSMRLVPDDKAVDELAEIRTNVGELPPAQQAQFENILNSRVLHPLGLRGELNGQEFKDVESYLTTEARGYKSSQDHALRKLGDALEDVTGSLRDNLERSSDPGIRPALKKANESWALLTRLEDAAQARKGSGGIVTPSDLLGSVRKMDRSVRHRSFARGDALLQKFGEDAFDVLGNKVSDSGTAERAFANLPRGMVGASVGGAIGGLPGMAIGAGAEMAARAVTNPAGEAGMNMLKKFAAHAPATRNYLLRSEAVRRAPVLSLNNLPRIANQPDGQ